MKPSSFTHLTSAISAPPPNQLASYLAGTLGTAVLMAAPQAEAAVTAVTFGFGAEYNSGDLTGTRDWAVDPGMGTIRGITDGSNLGLGTYSFYGMGSVYHAPFAGDPDVGLAQFFDAGTVIGAGGNGARGFAWFQQITPSLNFNSDQLSQNIGFVTSAGNWGWANVSWTEANKNLAINSAYVESVAGNTITVGDTGISAAPEPSRALLALAGLAGVALRRRRKQAA